MGGMFGTFAAGLAALRAAGAATLIVDVSSNPGGSMCAAVAMTERLVPSAIPRGTSAAAISLAVPANPQSRALYAQAAALPSAHAPRFRAARLAATCAARAVTTRSSDEGDGDSEFDGVEPTLTAYEALFPATRRAMSDSGGADDDDSPSSEDSSAHFCLECGDYVTALDGTGAALSLGYDVDGGDAAGWIPDAVAIVSDGLCRGACATFVSLLRARAGVRAFVHGPLAGGSDGDRSNAHRPLAATSSASSAHPASLSQLAGDAAALAGSGAKQASKSFAAAAAPLLRAFSSDHAATGPSPEALGATLPLWAVRVNPDDFAPTARGDARAEPVEIEAAGDSLGSVAGRVAVYRAVAASAWSASF
ncbi:hypothetical protein HK405_010332 [Cladochytrium tenue]|nr:hypothetical protein HK405_010332 [Cladochytrium tenue]